MLPSFRKTQRIPVEVEPRRYFLPFLGAAVGLGGSLLGKASQDSALDAAGGRIRESLAELRNLPEYQFIEGMPPQFENLPAELQAQMIAEDPSLKSTQIAALQNMKELTDKGLSAEDAYNYMQAEQRAGVESRGQQEAIINEMQRKGVGGSGLEYALRTRVSQDAVDRFAENQAAQAAKAAEQRALANLQSANLAGAMRGQDFTVNNANTSALNRFAEQNLRNKMDVENRNVNRTNVVNQSELSERRRIADQKVADARNLATQRANLNQGLQAQDLARGSAQSNMYNDIFNTLGNLGGSVYNQMQQPQQSGGGMPGFSYTSPLYGKIG